MSSQVLRGRQSIHPLRRVSVAFGCVLSGLLLLTCPVNADAQFGASFLCGKTDPHDNAELRQLIGADQAMRNGAANVPDDAARLARVLALYHADSLQTAADFANASLILQHGRQPEHYLLAHEFTMAGVMLGCGGSLGSFMLPASEYRLLNSLGLNADVLQHSAVTTGVQIITKDTPVRLPRLTLLLVQQARRIRTQLLALRRQHPDYPWLAMLRPESPADTVTAALSRTPLVAAVFRDAHLTPAQWHAVEQALDEATWDVTWANMAPKPMLPVTGDLHVTPTAIEAQNIAFVQAHQAELAQVGVEPFTPRPVASELTRPRLVPVALPPDDRVAQGTDPCPTLLADTLDNPELRTLATRPSLAGSPTATRDSVAARRTRVLALLQMHAIRTPRDEMRAAGVLVNGSQPEDALHSHDLALAALDACGDHAVYLAAASEDRFLVLLGLKQRFGTLPSSLVPVDTGPAAVTQEVRRLLHLPTARGDSPATHGQRHGQ